MTTIKERYGFENGNENTALLEQCERLSFSQCIYLETEQCERAAFSSTKTDRNEYGAVWT